MSSFVPGQGQRIVVFADPSYQGVSSQDILAQLLPAGAHSVAASDLATALQEPCDLLVSFHGPYFPKAAWNDILAYLERGGNLAVFGGMPFTQPVLADGTIEPENRAYTDQLQLGPFFPLDLPSTPLQVVAARESLEISSEQLPYAFDAQGRAWSFYPRLTQVSDHPEELGSAGPFDTLLTPLLYLDEQQPTIQARHYATVMSLLDQQAGRFAGGRWLLSPWQPASHESWLELADVLKGLLSLVSSGVERLEAAPLHASYQPGDTPTLLLTVQSPYDYQAHITISTPDNDIWLRKTLAFTGTGTDTNDPTTLQVPQEQRLQLTHEFAPGLYRVEVAFERQHADSEGLLQHRDTGFWIWDASLVATTAGKRLTAGRTYFMQQDEPVFLYGTTYMDSKVQRKFLAQPNPLRWQEDFATMKQAGINVIRTGVWTAWRDLMPNVGFMNEAALRALDAFVLSAVANDLQVVFTFFSFYPTLFDGVNPWLDPRSLQGQREYVRILARRYASVETLSWDLINEPSFGDPKHIFNKRPIPNYDRYERKAFQHWLAQRYTLAELQLRWRQTPGDFTSWEQVSPPPAEHFAFNARNTEHLEMLQVADYTLFSQEMFKQWAALMYQTIRAAGNQALVGVGQDEAQTRISPQFYAEAVDYGTTHPWWNNDDLLCDMLFDKTIEKPNVIQEIGVMLARDVDMLPWRSEQECANLLERKLITGIAARGAGLIQWLWHTNALMTSENENSIGLVRADGSIKPEYTVMHEVGQLTRALEGQLSEIDAVPETWVVLPYSQWFSRPDLVTSTQQRLIRILGYDLGIIPQLVAEQQLPTLVERYQPRTIILPSIQQFSQEAWEALLTFVARGSKLIVSGLLGRDQHNLSFPTQFEQEQQPRPVSRYEYVQHADGTQQQFSFDGDKMVYVKKAHNAIKTYQHQQGSITWSGLPFELASSPAEISKLYRQLLGITTQPTHSENPVLVVSRPLKQGTLTLLVNDSGQEQHVTLSDGSSVTVAAERAGAVLVTHDGQVRYFSGVH